jgi:hypothetical protein
VDPLLGKEEQGLTKSSGTALARTNRERFASPTICESTGGAVWLLVFKRQRPWPPWFEGQGIEVQ